MSLEIECPLGAGSGSPHNVVPGTGLTGIICAHGLATRDRVKERDKANAVWAKIFESFDGGALENQSHVNHPDAKQLTINNDGFWRDEAIPGARHGPANATLPNILVVWAVYPGSGNEEFATQPFFGVTAQAVSCCEGSGTGSGDSRDFRQKGGAKRGVGLALAPLLWHLAAAGFEGGRALFNGPWALALRGSPNGQCVWNNGGDARRTPLVELRCESPVVTTWRLILRHNGEAVEYVRPAVEWNPIGANDVLHTGNGVAAGTAPDRLTLTPG